MYIGFFEASHRTYSSEKHSSQVPSMFTGVSCYYGTRVTPICDKNGVVLLFASVTAIIEYCQAHGIQFATCSTAQTLDDSISHGGASDTRLLHIKHN